METPEVSSVGSGTGTTGTSELSSVSSRFSSKLSSKVSSKFSFGEDENQERGNWSGRLDFLLSCIGYAVGFGNIWRFPYLCYRNGGGAFLIPYTLMLGLAGLPLFFLELAFGQFSSLCPITIWRISPLFKGVGYAMVTISALVSIYYNVILAYVIFYLCASMTSRVPWSDCHNEWNTGACVKKTGENATRIMNLTAGVKPTSPALEYWERYVLEMSPGIDQPGGIKWQLALCLLAAWTIVFFCLIKGIKSSGKVVYFTAVFPYVVLVILLVRGVTLPGAGSGVYFYIVPDFNKLGHAQVWGDAAVQIFYSLGPAWGGLITMASYNRFHNNCYRDSLVVAIINCGTSVFAGFVIFSVIGFLSYELDLPIANATSSGPGLAFVAYPEGLARMPGAPFWSVLFFFMLITLGLDSMFAMMETVISSLCDEYPEFLRPRKTLFTLVLCVLFFLLGLPQVTRGGVYIMNLMDWYCAGFSLLVVSVFEVSVLMYIYGYGNFAEDIKSMIGFTPNLYWRVCWCLVTPFVILFILVFNAVTNTRITYNDYLYPAWAETLGWFMMTSSIVFIPVVMVTTVANHIGGFKRLPGHMCSSGMCSTIRRLVAPQDDWGPALNVHRKMRYPDAEKTSGCNTSTSKDQFAYDNPAMQWPSVMYESHV